MNENIVKGELSPKKVKKHIKTSPKNVKIMKGSEYNE